MITAEIMRTLLLIVIAGMLFLAVAYLSQRKLTPIAFCGWSLLALVLPILGPIIVILSRPGKSRSAS